MSVWWRRLGTPRQEPSADSRLAARALWEDRELTPAEHEALIDHYQPLRQHYTEAAAASVFPIGMAVFWWTLPLTVGSALVVEGGHLWHRLGPGGAPAVQQMWDDAWRQLTLPMFLVVGIGLTAVAFLTMGVKLADVRSRHRRGSSWLVVASRRQHADAYEELFYRCMFAKPQYLQEISAVLREGRQQRPVNR